MNCSKVCAWLSGLLLLAAAPSSAADTVVVKDGDTIALGGTTFRLDGIDAPEFDQVCLDEAGTVWACGVAARNRLAEFIGKRTVRCDDKGPAPAYPAWRIGICSVEGEPTTLNQWLVHEGLAINFEPYARGRFLVAQVVARQNGHGLWRGCFATPRDLRYWSKKNAEMLGAACPSGDHTPVRNALFPDHPAMPPDCPIKGTMPWHAALTGHTGIYHMEGCDSYRRTTNPRRWFCSEEAAHAEHFRKAFNCWRTGAATGRQ